MGSEAEDIFHDALVIMVGNLMDGSFSSRSTLETYLWSIAHKLCLRQYARSARDERYVNRFFEDETHTADPEVSFMEMQVRSSIETVLDKLPPQCREILRMWMRKYSMQEIALHLNYENAVVVRNIKSRCLKKLASLISSNPDLRRMLEELIKND